MEMSPDPFADVYDACEPHREQHGPACGVYPSNPRSMALVRVLVSAARPNRVLEIGGGIGYSGLHIASAMPDGAELTSIERDAEHVELATSNFEKHRLRNQAQFVVGSAVDVIPTLLGEFDFVYDDGWFAKEPAYLESMVDAMRPGALVVMANWFLLEDAITGEPRQDWSVFAGPVWADDVKAYARTLSAHPRLEVAFLPLVAVGVRKQ